MTEVSPYDENPDERVAAALAELDTLGQLPPGEHVEVYEQVHRVLHDALADAAGDAGDAQPGPQDSAR